MAPIELSELSSNWKRLQQRLKATAASKPPPPSTADSTEDKKNHLKRKRPTTSNGESKRTSKSVNGNTGTAHSPHKHLQARKRQKMEEPASIGASAKRHDAKSLTRSISMPSLKQNSLLSSSQAASESISVLTPSPHHPDIENEGVSSTALPGKYIALDCEMVGTGPEPNRDSALARVSVVNYHGHQVYDSYVQVKVPVTDYRTAVSGIEPRHLQHDTARPFKEVHSDLKVLLEGRILVGHAVKHDLDALLLKHDKRFIRDTSKYSKFREIAMIPGRTPGLKHLADKLLGVEIQVGSHSSVEDARATMALFRLEKERFEIEVAKMYGHMKPETPKAVVEIGGGEVVKKKNRKKKKKKKN